jgi:hypothetical protein
MDLTNHGIMGYRHLLHSRSDDLRGPYSLSSVSRNRRSWFLVSQSFSSPLRPVSGGILLIPSPGCLMYLCFWYPPSVRATRMAFFSASITVAGTLPTSPSVIQ